MAAAILCQFPRHKPVLDARVKVDYVFAHADLDDYGIAKNDAIRHRGQKALGLCHRIKLKERVMGRGDVEITLDGDWWDKAGEEERRALLDHELYHICVETDQNGKALTDDFSRPKITMRPHDYEFGWFAVIAECHGQAAVEVQQAQMMMDKAGQWFWPGLEESARKEAARG